MSNVGPKHWRRYALGIVIEVLYVCALLFAAILMVAMTSVLQ